MADTEVNQAIVAGAQTVAKAVYDAIQSTAHTQANAVNIATIQNDQLHMRQTVEELREAVYDKHEPVINWTRDFIDSYRKVLTAIVVSGIITAVGLMIQLYSMIQKGK